MRGHLLDRLARLLHPAEVDHLNGKAVAQDLRVRSPGVFTTSYFFSKVSQASSRVIKRTLLTFGTASTADWSERPCASVSVSSTKARISFSLSSWPEILLVDVVGHEGKRAHDEQAGHGDADSRKGHKAVAEQVHHALVEK